MEGLSYVGDLPEFAPKQHPMRGSIFFNPANETQIIVKGFYYPQVTLSQLCTPGINCNDMHQPGPDAFFWAGENLPSCSSESISQTVNYLLDTERVGSK